jgi:hypothetical protein
MMSAVVSNEQLVINKGQILSGGVFMAVWVLQNGYRVVSGKKGDKNDKINLIRICKYVRSRVKVSSCLQQVLKNVIPPMPCFTPYCLTPSCFDALYKFTHLLTYALLFSV